MLIVFCVCVVCIVFRVATGRYFCGIVRYFVGLLLVRMFVFWRSPRFYFILFFFDLVPGRMMLAFFSTRNGFIAGVSSFRRYPLTIPLKTYRTVHHHSVDEVSTHIIIVRFALVHAVLLAEDWRSHTFCVLKTHTVAATYPGIYVLVYTFICVLCVFCLCLLQGLSGSFSNNEQCPLRCRQRRLRDNPGEDAG